MKPVCYVIEQIGSAWIVSANGRKMLSFDNEQNAVAAINDATTLLLALKPAGINTCPHGGWSQPPPLRAA
jgi:hypothetical protein